jgi:ATP synthase protein I
MKALGTVGSVGFAFVIAIALGWWFGSLLDRWLGTSPWLTFLFFFLGVAAGALNVFRALGPLGRPPDARGR